MSHPVSTIVAITRLRKALKYFETNDVPGRIGLSPNPLPTRNRRPALENCYHYMMLRQGKAEREIQIVSADAAEPKRVRAVE